MQDKIAAIKQRAEKATKGKWIAEYSKANNAYEIFPVDENGKTIIEQEICITADANKDTADFIAYARQDIPNLANALEVATKYINDMLNFEDELPDGKDVLAKIDQIIKGKDGKN